MTLSSKKPWGAVLAAALLLTTTACASGSLNQGSGAGGDRVQLKLLYSISNNNTAIAEGLSKAFNESQDRFNVTVESRPGGGEGDNIIKTRLATNEMTDIFQYNSGSLMRNLNPGRSLVDLSGEPWVSDLTETFKPAVSAEDKVYGAPWGAGSGGGIMYNKLVYDELGLSVPRNWDEFMANNAKIKEAGKTPVLQSYGTTWTSQLFVLGDYANVAKKDPQWAEKYTANQAKFSQEPAIEGFEYTEELLQAGYINEDAAAATQEQVLAKLASGEGAHFPILSSSIDIIRKNHPDNLTDIGFFGIPGKGATENLLTIWQPNGLYIPQSTTGDKLEGAKQFLAFAAGAEGCKIMNDVIIPDGPFGTQSCEPTADIPPAVEDIVAYEEGGKAESALEFISPLKGPNLEHIIILVGTGQETAAGAAALYDEDLKKQAQQLALPGW